MSATGPKVDDQQIEDAYNDVLLLLNQKYNIQRHPPDEFFAISREKTNAFLREAIREVLYQEECEHF